MSDRLSGISCCGQGERLARALKPTSEQPCESLKTLSAGVGCESFTSHTSLVVALLCPPLLSSRSSSRKRRSSNGMFLPSYRAGSAARPWSRICASPHGRHRVGRASKHTYNQTLVRGPAPHARSKQKCLSSNSKDDFSLHPV